MKMSSHPGLTFDQRGSEQRLDGNQLFEPFLDRVLSLVVEGSSRTRILWLHKRQFPVSLNVNESRW
jgi:hypothetical protein